MALMTDIESTTASPLRACTVVAVAEPGAEGTKRSRPLAGPQIGVFVPSSGGVRQRFGDRWSNFGFGWGAVRAPKQGGAWSADLSFLSNRRTRDGDQGNALLVPFGGEYRIALGEPAGVWRPYGGGTVGGVAAWLDDPLSGRAVRGRIAPSAGLFAGVAFGARAYVEVHGYAFGRTGDWSAGGWNFAAGVRF
ncbi:MAG: hypothetical protein ACKO5K_07030 [Armatimonadota bacterium]